MPELPENSNPRNEFPTRNYIVKNAEGQTIFTFKFYLSVWTLMDSEGAELNPSFCPEYETSLKANLMIYPKVRKILNKLLNFNVENAESLTEELFKRIRAEVPSEYFIPSVLLRKDGTINEFLYSIYLDLNGERKMYDMTKLLGKPITPEDDKIYWWFLMNFEWDSKLNIRKRLLRQHFEDATSNSEFKNELAMAYINRYVSNQSEFFLIAEKENDEWKLFAMAVDKEPVLFFISNYYPNINEI